MGGIYCLAALYYAVASHYYRVLNLESYRQNQVRVIMLKIYALPSDFARLKLGDHLLRGESLSRYPPN